jgi:DNA-binding MarR family transcriptional regulator
MGRKRETAAGSRADFAYHGLDRTMHEQARLGILTSLVTHSTGLVFSEIKELCDLTDGNLSRHLAALEAAHLIEAKKGKRDRYPQTLYRLTDGGRRRFLAYIDELERVVTAAQLVRAPSRERIRGSPAFHPT